MNTPTIIRFNRDDKIISTHASWVQSLSKINRLDEKYIELAKYDLSDLCELSDLKKGATIKGLYAHVAAVAADLALTKLMVKHLNKEVIDSDIKPHMCKSGEITRNHLIDTLGIYNISFDEWLEQYETKGREFKIEEEAVLLKEAEEFALRRTEIEACNDHFAGACFSLPGIAGKMGAGVYYTVQIPFGQVPQLFKFNEELVPVELRAQRVLNEKRAEAIADYIISRRLDYTLPALTASVSELMKFEPVQGFSNLGAVQIPIGATMLINDGQHRRRGIEIALERDPLLRDQSISVVLFYDQGLQRSQQMFADINDRMVKPPKALSILFDSTNKMNRLVIDAIEVAGIKHVVEFEKSNPGSRSSKIWSVTALKKAAELLTGLNDKNIIQKSDSDIEDYKATFSNWLKALVNYTAGGLKLDVENGSAQTITDARTYRVSTHAAFLHSVALASRSLHEGTDVCVLKRFVPPLFDELEILAKLSMLKTADVWRERIVNTDGTMNPTANGIKLGAYVILERLGESIPTNIEEVNSRVFGGGEIAA